MASAVYIMDFAIIRRCKSHFGQLIGLLGQEHGRNYKTVTCKMNDFDGSMNKSGFSLCPLARRMLDGGDFLL